MTFQKISNQISLFADDTKVSRIIVEPTDNDALQQDIYKLQKWSDKWLLRFHPEKCVKMSVNSKGEASNYRFNDTEDSPMLKNVKVEKDIGIQIDENLEFDIHISEKVNIARSLFKSR